MRIIVTGAAGRLGAEVCTQLAAARHEVTALRRTDLDITDAERVAVAVRDLQPQAIVNCTAYNAVDKAETEKAAAFAINADGPLILAQAAAATGALLVHFSTDFVFDGCATSPYPESAPTNPLSVYGASKLSGEEHVRSVPRHYILRVESLFGGRGVHGHRATVDYITDNLLAGKVVHALSDRTVTPSFVADVAGATRQLIEGLAPFGTYHCVNSGATTWYALAAAIAGELGIGADILPVHSTDFETIAPRPRYCALANAKLRSVGIEMPTWQGAIQRHLEQHKGAMATAARG